MSPQPNLNDLARQCASIPGSVSWEDVHAAIAREGKRRGEWAGLPMPIEGMSMMIHPSYPFSQNLAKTFMPTDGVRHVCRSEDVEADTEIRNSWRSFNDGREVTIWRDGKKFRFSHTGRMNTGSMLLSTIGASRAWDFNAEIRAMEALKAKITEWAYQCYVMTGSFLESSPKSHVVYLFRRLRPTVAMSGQPDYKNGRGDQGMRILACLCAHPVGYYNDSWAGALVPTDDVLAHLLLMRSDEHEFWKQANHHHPLAPESGL